MRTSRLVEFFKTAGFLGGGSVVLAIILFSITGLEHYWDHNVKASIFATLGILFFCVGTFIAWSKERDKYEAEIERNGKPRLELLFDDSVELHYDVSRNSTYLLFGGSVINHGATSAASSWAMWFNSDALNTKVLYTNLPNDKTNWKLPRYRTSLVLVRDKMLPYVSEQAVESGHTKQGRLLFFLPGNHIETILTEKATIHIGCQDRINVWTWKLVSPLKIHKVFGALPSDEFADNGAMPLELTSYTPTPEPPPASS